MKRLLLKTHLPPGDIMTLTVAIESLHNQYPGKYLTGVNTLHQEIFHNNPWITKMREDKTVEVINMEYSSIHKSNSTATSFINGYTEFLAQKLQISIVPIANHPVLYLEDKEKEWISQVQEIVGKKIPFWIVNAGIKTDFTNKSWPVEYYQEVVDKTKDRIQWVQIGSQHDTHPTLKNVINLVGKTSLRELIRLVWHASGGLGPVTLLQHVCAAWERPYMCLVGGREPLQWIQYPVQTTFHTLGQFDCCKTQACWKSRVVKQGRVDDEKNHSLCELPVLGMSRASPRCMVSITPTEVSTVIRKYL